MALKSRTSSTLPCSSNEQECRSWEGARPDSEPKLSNGNIPYCRCYTWFTGWLGWVQKNCPPDLLELQHSCDNMLSGLWYHHPQISKTWLLYKLSSLNPAVAFSHKCIQSWPEGSGAAGWGGENRVCSSILLSLPKTCLITYKKENIGNDRRLSGKTMSKYICLLLELEKCIKK